MLIALNTLLVTGILFAASSTTTPLTKAREDPVISRICVDSDCRCLVLHNGEVRFRRKGTGALSVDRAIGPYLKQYQRLVASNELPILERSYSGWRIIVSAALIEDEDNGPIMKFRFFGPTHHLIGDYQGDLGVLNLRLGRLFGGESVIAAATTEGVHAYDNMAIVWLLPERGALETLLQKPGSVARIENAGPNGTRAGVWVNRQIYDGVHPETKREIHKFWQWRANERKLVRQ